jgi:hypothetical protein
VRNKTEKENPNLTEMFQSSKLDSRDLGKYSSKYSNSKFKLNMITRLKSQSLFNRSISALLNSDSKLKLKEIIFLTAVN